MAALIDIVKKGSTSRAVTLRIVDSTDGTPETGVVFNTSGIDLWYRRELSARTAITEATLAALTTAWASGGFLHISDGEYRLDVPDAAFATGAQHVDIGGTVTGMIVIGGRVRLVDYDPEDTVRLGLTSLPNAAAAATGGLYVRGTGAGAINQDANGRIDVNIAAISTDTTSADNLELYTDGTTPAPVNLTQWIGTAPLALTSQMVQTSVAAMQTDTVTAAAVAANSIDASALATDAVSEITAAIKALVIESNASITLGQAMSVMLSALAGVTASGGGVLKDPSGTTTRITATIDGSNNRTAMTLNPSA